MRLILGAIMAALLGPAVAWAEATPLPGYWELSNTAKLVISSRSTEKKCFTAADIDKVLEGPSNRHYKCTYPIRVVGGGKIRLTGTCVTKRGQVAEVTAEGTYSATAFRLRAKLKTKISGVQLAADASTTARRLGDICPPAV